MSDGSVCVEEQENRSTSRGEGQRRGGWGLGVGEMPRSPSLYSRHKPICLGGI